MGAAVDELTGLVESEDCYEIPWRELLPRQIKAANELFQERVGEIKLLANRAEETGVREVKSPADVVPLLFAHTSYKSYPENWFTQGKWDRMSSWVNTLTAHRVPKLAGEVAGVDDWVEKLGEVGHQLSCSSGTTGKCSIIPSSDKDMAFVRNQISRAMSWATGIPRTPEFVGITVSPMAAAARNLESGRSLREAFMKSQRPFPAPPITVGQVSSMVALRRSITDGTALPADIAAFEEISRTREKAIADAVESTAQAIVDNRGEKLFIQGMLGPMWQITERVREMGYGSKDFGPDNTLLTGGGAKGVPMPPDAREQIFATYNISRKHAYQFYGMQEMNTTMPRCSAGRYHVAPWVMLLVLNADGDVLIEPESDAAEIEGRAGFFDLSLDGRWSGVISGDKITARYGRCDCGHQGPTIGDQIVRYSDLPGGDKITCAGTIDAYVRGAA
jgi:hypothetical protein